MIIKKLFPDIAALREYVPGVAADQSLSELNPSAISAQKHIADIITPEIWNAITDAENDTARPALASAFGNLIMAKALVFEVVAKRISGGPDVYKYEQETMRRQYMDNYFNAMDSLMATLSTDPAHKENWEKTSYSELMEQLKIKTAGEFNTFYGIDSSFLFFFRSMPIQREILLDGLDSLFKKTTEREDLTTKLKLALAQMVVAIALMRFDIIELPATIRSLFDEQKASRSGAAEQNRILALAASLQDNAIGIISAVEVAINETGAANVVSNTSLNKPEDKIYLLT